MTKYILLILVGMFSLSITIPVNAGHGMAGCGLGSLVIKENNKMQIFAATTNGTSANQTFAITTGTSNCSSGGISLKSKEQEIFVHVNYDSLEKEIATGKGEKLNALAGLFGCSKNSKEFASFTKSNFSKLFSEKENPNFLLSSLREEFSKSSLKTVCQL